jgi:hypothetical protein
MPKYVIEREIAGAGSLTDEQLREITRRSCCVIEELGRGIQWIESHVTDDRIYCVYVADNEELIREHGRRGGFPVTRVSEVRAVIGPKIVKPRAEESGEDEETGTD